MLMSLLALHKIAAQRSDGLHPELLRLLERSTADAEAKRAEDGKNRPKPEAISRSDPTRERAA
jgi:hypothetical protein